MWVKDYYDTIESEECSPAGFAVNPNIVCVLPFMCHEDEQTAIDRGLDGCPLLRVLARGTITCSVSTGLASPTSGRTS